MHWEEPENTGINWNGAGTTHPCNSMPTPYEEITMEEYMAKYVTDSYGIQSINFRQVLDLVSGQMWTVKFVNYVDATYAVAYHYMRKADAQKLTGYMFCREDQSKDSYHTYFTRFYKIGCWHGLRGMTLEEINERGLYNGMHDHNYICDKCGYTYSTESSE